MIRLSQNEWNVIFNNLEHLETEDLFDNIEWVEILWSDSDNEWMLCYGEELFEDGFKTENEAIERLRELENNYYSEVR